MKLVHAIFVAVVFVTLSGCAARDRWLADWEQYENSSAQYHDVVFATGFDETWSAIIAAVKELNYDQVAIDKASGLLTLSKKEPDWANATYQVNVLARSQSTNETSVRIRIHMLGDNKKPPNGPRVYPTSGELEIEFFNRLKAHISVG